MTAQRFLRRGVVVVLTGFAIAIASPSAAQDGASVAVEVIDVAGRQAYVQPGADAGIHKGDTVTLGRKRYPVLAATRSSALIEVADDSVRIGANGTSTTSLVSEEVVTKLAAPRPLAAFRDQWPRPVLPASTQHPAHVPLGTPARDGAVDARLSLRTSAIAPVSGGANTIADSELRGRVHYEPLHEAPLAIDADVAGRAWLGHQLDRRAGGRSRPNVRVRELQAAYGSDAAFLAALGRLRYASRTLGTLDGVRAQTSIYGGTWIGAFGGFVPNPLDERPDLDASRFGAELGYRDVTAELRPDLSLTAQGSRFAGKLDERRLSAFIDVYPGDSHAGGYAELSLFPKDNPWNARAVELSAAGVDGNLRIDDVELGARLDLQRPERSLWLATFLPTEWLCVAAARTPPATEACHGDETRYLAAGDAAFHSGRLTLRGGITKSGTTRAEAEQLGAFLHALARDVVARMRLEAGVDANTGSLLHGAGASVGVGSGFAHDTWDLALRYRPSWNHYQADTAAYFEHTVSGSVAFLPSPSVSLELDTDVVTGRDVDVLLVSLVLGYRPEL